jgi:hypothetical protein
MLFEVRARRTLKAGLYQPECVDRRRHGKSAPQAPAAPDPNAVAAAQSGANKEAVLQSAKVNQINQNSPYGSLSYSGTVGEPDRTATTTFNPTAQATYDQQQQLAKSLTGDAAATENQVSQVARTPFDISQAPKVINPNATNLQQVQDAVYGRNTQYLDPQFQQGQHDLENKLANQGIPVGSEAYDREMANFGRQKQQAYGDARDAAIQAGGAEQSRAFGVSQAAHQQGVADLTTQRTQPMNELAAYLQGSPALQGPNFGQPAQYQVNPADVTNAYGLAQSAKNTAYQGGVNQATAANSTTGGLLGTAGTVAAMYFF